MNIHYIFYLHIFISWKKGGGGSALNIISIFYTHHRIPNKDMMTINFDTITSNYEVIYVIKTVMKYHLKKMDTSFHQPLLYTAEKYSTNDLIHRIEQSLSKRRSKSY
jgi:hypothetical protein